MILFRADGNSKIGSGHIMRSLSIADALTDLGEKCLFLLADESFYTIISERGYDAEVLHTDYTQMETELCMLPSLFTKFEPKWILVDSYFVTPSYLLTLKKYANVAYLDDIATFAYPVDLLINYNIFGPEIPYNKLYESADLEQPKSMLGLNYAPLRKEFSNIPSKMIKETIENVFISTGGADPEHIAISLVKDFIENPDSSMDKITFHFVLGAMNQDLKQITELAKGNPQIKLYHNVKNMSVLMQQCDLAISAAGSTMYELCACGVPTITYVLADNQIDGASAFQKQNLALYIGDYRKTHNISLKLRNAIIELDNNPTKRMQMSIQMQHLIGGNGANLLAEELLNFTP